MGFFIPLRATSGWLGGTVPSGQFAVPLVKDGLVGFLILLRATSGWNWDPWEEAGNFQCWRLMGYQGGRLMGWQDVRLSQSCPLAVLGLWMASRGCDSGGL